MTGPDGDLSSPAPLRAGTGPSSGSFAVSDGESWRCRQCETSSTSKLFGSPQAVYGHMHVHKGPRKQQAEGGKKKRKKEVSYALGMSQSSSPSGKQFKNHQASWVPMRVHNNQPQRQMPQVHEEQDEELARTLLELGRCDLNKMEGRETKGDGSAVAEGGASLSAADLNKDAPEDDERETKGDGSAVAEGGASLSEADTRRKRIHMNLDLNKVAPKDDERETKGDGSAVAEGGASLSEADTRRKQIHMNFDLNKVAPEGA